MFYAYRVDQKVFQEVAKISFQNVPILALAHGILKLKDEVLSSQMAKAAKTFQ